MNHLVDQYFDSLSDKKVAVLGIGVSNRPLIRMLLARGIHVLACDKTPREKLDAEVLELEQARSKGTFFSIGFVGLEIKNYKWRMIKIMKKCLAAFW